MSANFFSIEEAFIRLGQNRRKGCLVVFNRHEAAHIFVEDAVAVCALADKRYGEDALAHALHLEEGSYSWLEGVDAVIKNLQFSITEYAQKRAVAKDARMGQTMVLPKQATKPLPKEELAKKLVKHDFNLDQIYYFTDEERPTVKQKLTRVTNVVGRDEYCDFILAHPQVSRRHCILQITQRGVLVKDLDSTNGTYANGFPIADGYINRGDRLSLGTYELTLHVEKNRG